MSIDNVVNTTTESTENGSLGQMALPQELRPPAVLGVYSRFIENARIETP